MDVGVTNISIEVLPPPLLTVNASTSTPAPVDATVGGPKGDDGYTPVKGVDYFDGTNGVDGADGREVELQNNGTYIQWRYVGGSWSDLVALASLRGTDGVDGQEVSLQVSGGYIQWRLGTGSWTNLIALSALTGADGREVEMRNSGTYIQWRYVGDPTWTDIVALSTLKGDKGDTGVSVPTGGTTGQTLLKNSSTDYDYSWATPPTAPVTSVAGKTGAVTLAKADVGLSSVDNTADASKSVASAATLTTARTIGGVSFNGSSNINLPGVNTAGNQSTTGNAGTATKLATARTINGVSFDGSANITVADSTKVPTTTTVNGKALSANITLNNTDVGAAATAHTHPASDLTATGIASNKFLRGDNTWQIPTNSTYDSITGATITTTTATVTLTVDRYQIMNYSSGKLTATLPASASVGATIEVFGLSSGGFRITAPSGDNILYPDGTNSGSAGWIEAPQYATVTLRCIVASTTWIVTKATLLITNNNGKTMPNPQSW